MAFRDEGAWGWGGPAPDVCTTGNVGPTSGGQGRRAGGPQSPAAGHFRFRSGFLEMAPSSRWTHGQRRSGWAIMRLVMMRQPERNLIAPGSAR